MDMLEKLLLGTLMLGMLLAFGLTKAVEADSTRVASSHHPGDPGIVTMDRRQ